MKRIAWIATLLGVVVLAWGCRPAPEEPADPPPEAAPENTVPTDLEQPAGAAEKPKVLDAVGKALFKSLVGDTEEEQPPEAPPFNPQL